MQPLLSYNNLLPHTKRPAFPPPPPPRSIVSYALHRHLPPGTSVVCLAGSLDDALRRKHSTPQADAAAAKLCEAAAERLG